MSLESESMSITQSGFGEWFSSELCALLSFSPWRLVPQRRSLTPIAEESSVEGENTGKALVRVVCGDDGGIACLCVCGRDLFVAYQSIVEIRSQRLREFSGWSVSTVDWIDIVREGICHEEEMKVEISQTSSELVPGERATVEFPLRIPGKPSLDWRWKLNVKRVTNEHVLSRFFSHVYLVDILHVNRVLVRLLERSLSQAPKLLAVPVDQRFAHLLAHESTSTWNLYTEEDSTTQMFSILSSIHRKVTEPFHDQQKDIPPTVSSQASQFEEQSLSGLRQSWELNLPLDMNMSFLSESSFSNRSSSFQSEEGSMSTDLVNSVNSYPDRELNHSRLFSDPHTQDHSAPCLLEPASKRRMVALQRRKAKSFR